VLYFGLKGDEMKPVNVSHISKYANSHESITIIKMLRIKMDLVLKYGYSKIERSGRTYYTKTQTSFFDIRKAVTTLEAVRDDPFWRHKEFDYQRFVDILKSVLADRLEFNDRVPNTTDTWGDFYSKNCVVRIPRRNRSRIVADKKAKREKFVKLFSETEIVWS